MINKKDLKNLEGLSLLTAVAQTTGKRQAARVLNTSIDTINKYLSDFEKEMGMKLIDANSRGSTLTPAGRKLVDKAGRIELILNEIYAMKPSRTEIKGQIRVGIMTEIGALLLMDGLNEFLDSYPGLTIVSITADTDQNSNDMSYDVGLSFAKPVWNNSVILHTKEIEFGFFASAEYLSRYGYPVNLEDMLQNFRIVVKVDERGETSWFHDLFSRARNICYSSNASFAVNEAVRHGVGIGVMPIHCKNDDFIRLGNIPCDVKLTMYLFADAASKDLPGPRTVINYYKSLMDMV